MSNKIELAFFKIMGLILIALCIGHWINRG
jgi:hypothetical protein